MMFHQNHKCLAISRHSGYNIFTRNSQCLVFLLPFITLEYSLILAIYIKLFQKQYDSLIKKFFYYIKRGKHSKEEGLSEPNEPYGHEPHRILL